MFGRFEKDPLTIPYCNAPWAEFFRPVWKIPRFNGPSSRVKGHLTQYRGTQWWYVAQRWRRSTSHQHSWLFRKWPLFENGTWLGKLTTIAPPHKPILRGKNKRYFALNQHNQKEIQLLKAPLAAIFHSIGYQTKALHSELLGLWGCDSFLLRRYVWPCHYGPTRASVMATST